MRYLQIEKICEAERILMQIKENKPGFQFLIEPYTCKFTRKQKRIYKQRSLLSYLINTLDLTFPDYSFETLFECETIFRNSFKLQKDVKEECKNTTVNSKVKEECKNTTVNSKVKEECKNTNKPCTFKNEECKNTSLASNVKKERKNTSLACDVKDESKNTNVTGNVKEECKNTYLACNVKAECKNTTVNSNVKEECTNTTVTSDVKEQSKNTTLACDVKEECKNTTVTCDVKEESKNTTKPCTVKNEESNMTDINVLVIEENVQKKQRKRSNSFSFHNSSIKGKEEEMQYKNFRVVDPKTFRNEIDTFFSMMWICDHDELVDGLLSVIKSDFDPKKCTIFQLTTRIGPFENCVYSFCFILFNKNLKRVLLLSGMQSKQ